MTKQPSSTSDFRKILERLSHRHDSRRVFDGFNRLEPLRTFIFEAIRLENGFKEENREEMKRYLKKTARTAFCALRP
jgi:hypothetical protein